MKLLNTNTIEIKKSKSYHNTDKNVINVGCFGSLRILKNQVFQALCSIKMAENLGKKLCFHVTADINIDDPIKSSVLKNLMEIFNETSKHQLIVHPWLGHDEFEDLIKHMDIGIQLSFTESFNIVTADFVNCGVPIVVSSAIDWMPKFYMASTTDYDETVSTMSLIYRIRNYKLITKIPRLYLKKYNICAKIQWLEFMMNIDL